jgi:hypothetical protein
VYVIKYVSGFTVFVVVYAQVQVTLPSAMANNKELLKLLKEVTAPVAYMLFSKPIMQLNGKK